MKKKKLFTFLMALVLITSAAFSFAGCTKDKIKISDTQKDAVEEDEKDSGNSSKDKKSSEDKKENKNSSDDKSISEDKSSGKTQKVSSTNNKVTVDVPKDWDTGDGEKGKNVVVFAKSGKQGGFIQSASAESLGVSTVLELEIKTVTNLSKDSDDKGKISDSKEFKINGNDAIQFQYKLSDSKYLITVFIAEGTAYQVLCKSPADKFDDDLNDYKKISNSIQIN